MWLFTKFGFFSVVEGYKKHYQCSKCERIWNEDPGHYCPICSKDEKGKTKPVWQNQGKWANGTWQPGPWVNVVKTRAEEPREVMVRARARIDLVNLWETYLKEDVPELKILEWKHRDYPYRIVILKTIFAKALTQIALDIDYSNFKNSVSETQGYARSHVYMNVWSDMNNLEFKVGREKRRKETGDLYYYHHGRDFYTGSTSKATGQGYSFGFNDEVDTQESESQDGVLVIDPNKESIDPQENGFESFHALADFSDQQNAVIGPMCSVCDQVPVEKEGDLCFDCDEWYQEQINQYNKQKKAEEKKAKGKGNGNGKKRNGKPKRTRDKRLANRSAGSNSSMVPWGKYNK